MKALKRLMKIKDINNEINELRCGFGEKVARVTNAVGVEHALNQPSLAAPAAAIILVHLFYFNFSFLSYFQSCNVPIIL